QDSFKAQASNSPVTSPSEAATAAISDPALRTSVKSDVDALASKTGDERIAAYNHLTSETDPAKRQEIKAALDKLTEQPAYKDNAFLKMAQASYSDTKPRDVQGPGLPANANEPDAHRLTNDA